MEADKQTIDARNRVLTEWSDVLDLAPRRGKGIAVTGALRIGEAKSMHAQLVHVGFRPAGKRIVWGNGEISYTRYRDGVV